MSAANCCSRTIEVKQRILPLVETTKRLERSPLEWLRAVDPSCIEKAGYSLSEELVLSTPSRLTVATDQLEQAVANLSGLVL